MRDFWTGTSAEKKEVRALLLSILFVLVGIGVIWLTKTLKASTGDATSVVLVLVPILAYLLLSDRIAELKGPGGLELKIKEVAASGATSGTSETVPLRDFVEIPKGPEGQLTEIRQRLGQLPQNSPVILTLQLGNTSYDPYVLTAYLQALSVFPNFKLVVLVDSAGRFVGCMAFSAVVALLTSPYRDTFLAMIREDKREELERYPEIATTKLLPSSTNLEALQIMTQRNHEALVVVGEDDRPKSVVERAQVVSRMVLALAK